MMALVFAAVAVAAAAQPAMDLVAFRDRVAAELRRLAPEARIILAGRVGLTVVHPGEEPKTQSMEVAYAQYRDEPERLTEIVQAYARSFMLIPIKAESLRVLVRREASNPPPGPGGPGDRGIVRPIADDLIAIVAVDGPDAFEFVRASRLREQLRLTDAELWARAMANTRPLMAFAPRPLTPGKPAHLETGEGLASSVLADDAFWNTRAMTDQGPIVVVAAGRDELYLALLKDTEVVQQFRASLKAAAGDQQMLFGKMLVRRDGRWDVLP